MTKIRGFIAMMGMWLMIGCGSNESVPPEKNNGAINVQVESLADYDGVIQSEYAGVVEAQKTTALSFAVMGAVTQVLVEEGQFVRKGQLLAKVNITNAQNAYEAALASLQQAQDAYNRMKPMKENGTLPEIKWVDVETGLAQAKSAVAIAQKGISDGNLYALENGTIGRKNIQPGMNVVPASTALELLDLRAVYIKIPVPEYEISSFKKGEIAQITIKALNKQVQGTIKEIGVAADILSHTYPVKIEVSNPSGDIKPGMICSVQTTTEDNRSGILVSNKALQRDDVGSQFVYIAKGDKAQKVPVQTITLIDDKVLVEGNLPQEAKIIISGQQKLSDGTSIRIIN